MEGLQSFEHYIQLKEKTTPWILYKHSPTCPISATAYSQVQKFEADHDTPIYVLNVLDSGDVKFEIADDLGVTHESPQVIIFADGKVKSHASHLSVSVRWLRQEIDGWNDTRG